MLQDLRIKRLAETLVHYSLKIKEGDLLLIQGSDLAAPLMREVYREALRAGGHPEVMVSIPGLSEIFLREASDKQLEHVSPASRVYYEKYDAMLSIGGGYNTRALSGVDPKRQAARSKATSELSRIFMERSAKGELRWCVTQYPTHSAAQEAGMSLEDYADFVFRACRVTEEDPVAAWRQVREEQKRLVEAISAFDTLRIVGEGTDLTLRVGGRKWISADGEHNFPDGEIFTGPVEDSAEGHIRFSFPAIHAGREVEDIRLTFKGGKVVEASAARGEELLKSLLAVDEGASRLGEIGIGTNFGIDRFTRNMLFDEKLGGTVHLALGAGYPETGSTNVSGIHWDMLCDLRNGGEIYGDGKLIYKEGKFLI